MNVDVLSAKKFETPEIRTWVLYIRVDRLCIAFIVIGANGIVRGEKVTSLARWPPNPSRCWALTMEDYWARSGGLLAVGPLFNLGRSVSTRSPNHGRLRDGRVGIKKVKSVGR